MTWRDIFDDEWTSRSRPATDHPFGEPTAIDRFLHEGSAQRLHRDAFGTQFFAFPRIEDVLPVGKHERQVERAVLDKRS